MFRQYAASGETMSTNIGHQIFFKFRPAFNTLVRSYDYLPLVHSLAIVIKNQKEKKQKEDAQIVLVCQLQKNNF